MLDLNKVTAERAHKRISKLPGALVDPWGHQPCGRFAAATPRDTLMELLGVRKTSFWAWTPVLEPTLAHVQQAAQLWLAAIPKLELPPPISPPPPKMKTMLEVVSAAAAPSVGFSFTPKLDLSKFFRRKPKAGALDAVQEAPEQAANPGALCSLRCTASCCMLHLCYRHPSTCAQSSHATR